MFNPILCEVISKISGCIFCSSTCFENFQNPSTLLFQKNLQLFKDYKYSTLSHYQIHSHDIYGYVHLQM